MKRHDKENSLWRLVGMVAVGMVVLGLSIWSQFWSTTEDPQQQAQGSRGTVAKSADPICQRYQCLTLPPKRDGRLSWSKQISHTNLDIRMHQHPSIDKRLWNGCMYFRNDRGITARAGNCNGTMYPGHRVANLLGPSKWIQYANGETRGLMVIYLIRRE